MNYVNPETYGYIAPGVLEDAVDHELGVEATDPWGFADAVDTEAIEALSDADLGRVAAILGIGQ